MQFSSDNTIYSIDKSVPWNEKWSFDFNFEMDILSVFISILNQVHLNDFHGMRNDLRTYLLVLRY